MKSIIIYHSLSGNTKQIAEAIHSGMSRLSNDVKITRMGKVNSHELSDYGLIGVGSFVQGFQEPSVVMEFIKGMPELKGKYAFTFRTHGTCAGSYIARMVTSLREKGLTVIGWNDWYGGSVLPIAPKPYYSDGHPDEIDLKEAESFGKEMVEHYLKIIDGDTQLIPELPEGEEYDKLYGVPVPPSEEMGKLMAEIRGFKPVYNAEKCNYPKCTICIDNCPTHSINLSDSPQISYETCGPCLIWFCEQLCPTGAIEVNWESIDKKFDVIKAYFDKISESMYEYKELRGFRNLLTEEEGRGTPLYKIKEHPKLVIQDGVVRERV